MTSQNYTTPLTPNKLKRGDTACVVAVSRSLSLISHDNRELADSRFAEMGLHLTFAPHAEDIDTSNSLPVADRVSDIENAFNAPGVQAIFSVIGGFNSIQLLDKIDFSVIAKNPKIFCGYSDVTVLLNAIHAKTGLVTYYGPHYSTFGIKYGNEYTEEYLKKCLFSGKSFYAEPSPKWSDDLWYVNQEKREFLKNDGFVSIQEGEAEGQLVGGNLNAFRLLHGTPFMPTLENKILFIENDGLDKEVTYQEFDRRLETILLQPGGKKLKGIAIGRFKRVSEMNVDKLRHIIAGKPKLRGLPIAYGFDFGHTNPVMTIPIGGLSRLSVYPNKSPQWQFINH